MSLPCSSEAHENRSGGGEIQRLWRCDLRAAIGCKYVLWTNPERRSSSGRGGARRRASCRTGESFFIGRIFTPWATRGECPRRGDLAGPLCRVDIAEPWREALFGIETCERLQLLYWMHFPAATSCSRTRGTAIESTALSRCARPFVRTRSPPRSWCSSASRARAFSCAASIASTARPSSISNPSIARAPDFACASGSIVLHPPALSHKPNRWGIS